jgi:nicotinamide mononucleotide transporter
MSPLELVAVLVSIAAIYATAQRWLYCWPVGLLSILLYIEVFRRAQLYSDVLLQLFFLCFNLYGWWSWMHSRHDARDEEKVAVDSLSWGGWLLGGVAGTLGGAVLGWMMARYTNAAIPHLDSLLTCLSLVGQYWTVKRYIASWWLWIWVDIVYTGVYAYKHLYLTAGLYAAFIVLAVIGLREWTQAWRAQQAESLGEPAAETVLD